MGWNAQTIMSVCTGILAVIIENECIYLLAPDTVNLSIFAALSVYGLKFI
jgi:hypothetical protein